MKLHNLGVTYAQGPLAKDQFAFLWQSPNPKIHGIKFWCRGGKKRICGIAITDGPADAAKNIWHWDGNTEEPTLSPSIGCDQRCGWHGHIIKGEILP